MTEYIYYAKPKGAPDHEEEIVLEMKRPITEEENARLHNSLSKMNMEFVRVWEYNGEAPDFAGTVKI